MWGHEEGFTTHANREELLKVLKKNREKHEREFNKAMKAWVKKSTKALQVAADKAKTDGWITRDPLKDLPKPTSYLESYNKAIRMVEMDARSVVELDAQTFNAWVHDEWEWRGAFAANTSIYNAH